VWSVQGDALGTALFFSEQKSSKTNRQRVQLEQALDRLASGWFLRSYPWAGSLSTAHTIFYYDHFGPGVFRDLAEQAPGQVLGKRPSRKRARLDLTNLATAEENEAGIWHELTHVRRHVSRQAYDDLAAQLPHMNYFRRA